MTWRCLVAILFLAGVADAMKWAQRSDRELLDDAEIAIEGEIVKRADPVDQQGDGASVATVKVTRVFKGALHEGEVMTVLFWSRRATSGSAFSKYVAPRQDAVGLKRIFLCVKKGDNTFRHLALPPEAAAARWMHAHDQFYDRQIAEPHFRATAEKLRR